MDEQLEKVLSNLVSQSGVVGVVVADSNGLCVSTKGNNAPSEVAGFLASIATRAKELAPKDLDEDPLVLIETEANNIFIRNQDEMTIGIYKIP